MRNRLIILVVLASLAGTACGGNKIKGEEVTYSANGVTLKGYIAYDSSKPGKRPGILVVHEWWGHNEYARKRARMLAELGYTALALDMFGDGKQAHHPDDAKKFAGDVMKDFEGAKARFNAAQEILMKHNTVDGGKIAAIGYCFGGAVVLNMARQGADLKGVVSIHGSLGAVKPAKKGDIKAKLLVLHGAADKFTSDEQLAAFKKEMSDADADMTFIAYPGAMHAFSNPEADEHAKNFNIPIAYNAEADKKSWEDMKAFLSSIFK